MSTHRQRIGLCGILFVYNKEGHMAARPKSKQDRRAMIRMTDALYGRIERLAEQESDRLHIEVSTSALMRILMEEALDAREAQGEGREQR